MSWHQLFVYGTKKGGFVELDLLVPSSDRYQLDVYLSQAPYYGIMEVSLDGKPIGQHFDGFSAQVARSGKLELGPLDLGEGDHRLHFIAVDRNQQSTGFEMGHRLCRAAAGERPKVAATLRCAVAAPPNDPGFSPTLNAQRWPANREPQRQ